MTSIKKYDGPLDQHHIFLEEILRGQEIITQVGCR